ncbi:MAG: hypothetical protein ISN29_05060 [Gammaproteobacteria bacterium AqS3]|nr:hypothetical protein [Gammaproteobacteria bacterium AqS3]
MTGKIKELDPVRAIGAFIGTVIAGNGMQFFWENHHLEHSNIGWTACGMIVIYLSCVFNWRKKEFRDMDSTP